MVQGGSCFSLPLEATESLCVVSEFFRKELQRDVATELQVFRLVDHTHAPAADLAEDAVMGNRLPHGLGGRGHWVHMLGGDEGKVNDSDWRELRLAIGSQLPRLTLLRDEEVRLRYSSFG